ncbi:MAG TPA: ferritin-like domain-containing protein [Acidimicrobiales bacterium]|nr:ferritin-like domain-containing protein [Acidimicrobiales bacterium]
MTNQLSENDMGQTSPQSLGTELMTASVSRRRFLIGSTVAAGLAVVTAACGSDDDDNASAGGGTTDTTGSDGQGGKKLSGDAAIAEFAAGLEVLAVNTYKSALDAATAGKLGAVPPAVATFVQTAMGHHQEHLDALNGVVTGAGGSEVTEPNAALEPTVKDMLSKVKDVKGAADLALTLEDIAAQTYLSVIPVLKSKEAIKLVGSIQVVDQQHQSILLYALGKYPVPETFQKTDKAAKPA